MVDDEAVVCDYCGADSGNEWLTTEILRGNGKEHPDFVMDTEYLGFCSPDHAGRYLLEGRLRAPDFRKPEPFVRTWRDRLLDGSVAALFLSTALLALLGLWTIIQWFID